MFDKGKLFHQELHVSEEETLHGELHNGMSFRDSPAFMKISIFQHCRKDYAIQIEHNLDEMVIYSCNRQHYKELGGMSVTNL